MNMSVLNLNNFFSEFFVNVSDGSSPNHRWPRMGAMGSPWPSMVAPWNVTTIGELHWSLSSGTFRPRFKAPSVSPQLRGNLALKASQPFVKFFLINHEFLILHDVKNRFLIGALFWYNSVNGA